MFSWNRIFVAVIFSFATTSMSGCATTSPNDLIFLSEAPEQGTAVTAPIGVVSDTQIHESRGTASRYLSKAGDEIVPVTIRTGQQVVGGADVLYEALNRLADMPLVMHLGDAIDVSCRTEWDAFQRTMFVGRPDGRWLLGSGNHDGFYAGNVSPASGDLYHDSYWDQVCNQGRYFNGEFGQRYLDKRQVIDANLHHLRDSWHISIDDSAPSSPICNSPNAQNLSLCASWSIEPEAPWRSFLVQMARLPEAFENSPPVFVLMLDSSTYNVRPKVAFNAIPAGTTAGFGEAQLDAAYKLLERMSPNAHFFLTAHHDRKSWKEKKWTLAEQDKMLRVFQDPRYLGLLVTSHTHKGGWYAGSLLESDFVELNTGSLADAPLYFRDLQFFNDGGKKWVVHSSRTLLLQGNTPQCAGYSLPKHGSGYSVMEQASQTYRHRKVPVVLRGVTGLGSALRNFFAFWRSKHRELNPQLLVYRDVVRDALPDKVDFSYATSDTLGSRPRSFITRDALVNELEELAACNDAERCSIQRKGRLLKALEDSLAVSSTTYDALAIRKSHEIRLCAAIAAAAEASRGDQIVGRVLNDSSPELVVLPLR